MQSFKLFIENLQRFIQSAIIQVCQNKATYRVLPTECRYPTKYRFLEKDIQQYWVTFKKRDMATSIFLIKEKKMTNNNHNYLYIGMKNCICSPKLEMKKIIF